MLSVLQILLIWKHNSGCISLYFVLQLGNYMTESRAKVPAPNQDSTDKHAPTDEHIQYSRCGRYFIYILYLQILHLLAYELPYGLRRAMFLYCLRSRVCMFSSFSQGY